MKVLKIGVYLIGMAIAGVGVAMAVTNPAPADYEAYATQQLSTYLQDNVCTGNAPGFLGQVLQERFMQEQCSALVGNNQDQLRQLIAEGTVRQNYLVLSLYTTNLSANQLLPSGLSIGQLPSYKFETVGLFNRFVTYQADRQ